MVTPPPPPRRRKVGCSNPSRAMQTLVLNTGIDSSTIQRSVIRVSVMGRYKWMPRVTVPVWHAKKP